MKVINTKWIDQNKGDEARPIYPARLIGREVAYEKRGDLLVATSPLVSLKAASRSAQAARLGHAPVG